METLIDLFLVFDGNCRQAIEFYTKVFDIDPEKIQITTYGELERNLSSKDYWEKVILGEIEVFGKQIYMADFTDISDTSYQVGTNTMISLGIKDINELESLFDAISVNGKIICPLEKTDSTELRGILRDQFGIIWQIYLAPKGQR